MRFSLLSVFVFIFFIAAVAQEPGLQQAGKPVSKINIQPIAPAVSKRLLLFRDNGTGKYGFLDSLTSQPVIQAQFDKSEHFNMGYARVIMNNKWGLIHYSGKVIIEPEWQEIGKPSEFKDYVRVYQNNKSGLFSLAAGKMIVKPDMLDFIELPFNKMGFTTVFMYDRKSGTKKLKYGLLDKTGKLLTPLHFDYLDWNYDSGFIKSKVGDLYGLIGRNGKELLPAEFELPETFHGTLQIVGTRGKSNFGLFDVAKGQYVLPPQYSRLSIPNDVVVSSFSLTGEATSYLVAVKDNKQGVVNHLGKIVVPVQYDKVLGYTTKLTVVKQKEKFMGLLPNGRSFELPFETVKPYCLFVYDSVIVYNQNDLNGIMDYNGKIITPAKFENVLDFSGPLSVAYEKGRPYGYVNKKGTYVIPPIYEQADPFSNGLAAVKKEGKWGYINTRGQEVIKKQFVYASRFNNGAAIVATSGTYDESCYCVQDGKWRLINTNNQNVLPGDFDDIIDAGEKLYWARSDGKWQLYSSAGKLIASTNYDDVDEFNSVGLARVKKEKKVGLVNKQGKLVVPTIYTYVSEYPDHRNHIEVEKDGKRFYIDVKGNIVK